MNVHRSLSMLDILTLCIPHPQLGLSNAKMVRETSRSQHMYALKYSKILQPHFKSRFSVCQGPPMQRFSQFRLTQYPSTGVPARMASPPPTLLRAFNQQTIPGVLFFLVLSPWLMKNFSINNGNLGRTSQLINTSLRLSRPSKHPLLSNSIGF